MRRFSSILIAAALAALCASAQTVAPPFSIRTQQATTVQVISDGGTLALPADAVGAPSDGGITVTYTGAVPTVTANITQIQLTGSTDFTLVSAPDLTNGPLALSPNATFGMRVRYLPSGSKLATAKITAMYMENNRAGSFSINLTGTAPEFAYTYALQPNGNSSLLNQGDTIQFPDTNLAETSSVLVILSNRGSGPGVVNAITYSGSSRFVLAQLPFPPATVDAGKDLRFAVRFTPDDFDPVTGAVQVDFAAGRKLSFKVQGGGLGSYIEYELLTPKGYRAMDAGESITLPDATLGGEKTTITVRVWNTGNVDGRVSAVSVSGAAFSLVESPFMPYTLAPDSFFTFKIQFSPTVPGKSAGRLRIGQDNFELEGNALGPNLTYNYAVAGGSVTLVPGNTVVLPAANVGQASTVRFAIKNDGTAAQDIFSISATGTGTAFAVSGLPTLPRRIAPNESVQFDVVFTPVVLGTAAGSLKIDTSSFPLTGVGNPPAALPEIAFQGATGAVEPAQQPAVGLSIAQPYALALSGTLTLTFTSDVFANDPAVQFSSGGRTVAFTIPAGSKQALFPNNATQVRLQTGTVAGTIALSPTFATQEGGIDLTPKTPPSLMLAVAQSAPRLLGVAVSAKTASGFTLLVTGYATGRSMTQMDFQLTGVPGENLATTKITVPVEPSFTAWYQGTSSVQYGSQFTATVPFTLAGEIKDTTRITSLVDTIQSVSVTLTNRQGVSTARSIDLK